MKPRHSPISSYRLIESKTLAIFIKLFTEKGLL